LAVKNPKAEDRTRRIVETAVALAERGGFDAVRLRDVAALADVALGTLYKRFRSKDDILVAALELNIERMEQGLKERPLPGSTPPERVTDFFKRVTRQMVRNGNLSRAVLRAVGSGTSESAEKVMRFRGRVTGLVADALRGPSGKELDEPNARMVASLLQDIWYASLVGWMAGLYKESEVNARVEKAAELLVRGAEG
jgi:AcrR family transcriptional regulator